MQIERPGRGIAGPLTAGRRTAGRSLVPALVLLLIVAGCAPRAPRQPSPPTPPASPMPQSAPSEPEPPPSTAAQLPDDCDGLRRVYREQIEAARGCAGDADCHVVSGDCAVGLEGCWHLVNRSLTSEDTAAIAARCTELGCTGPVCRCAPPPTHARCADGTCEAAP
jgi:hypothetical protein